MVELIVLLFSGNKVIKNMYDFIGVTRYRTIVYDMQTHNIKALVWTLVIYCDRYATDVHCMCNLGSWFNTILDQLHHNLLLPIKNDCQISTIVF